MYTVSVAIVMDAVVLFDYEKQQEDELDLAVGMTVLNVTQVSHVHQWSCRPLSPAPFLCLTK